MSSPLASAIAGLASADPSERKTAADTIYRAGRTSADEAVSLWWKDAELAGLLLGPNPFVTILQAVEPATIDPLSLHDALPIFRGGDLRRERRDGAARPRH